MPHTIIQNIKAIEGNLINHSLRFILWERANGEIPGILDEAQYLSIHSGIRKNPPILFARKFDAVISSKLIHQLNQET